MQHKSSIPNNYAYIEQIPKGETYSQKTISKHDHFKMILIINPKFIEVIYYSLIDNIFLHIIWHTILAFLEFS